MASLQIASRAVSRCFLRGAYSATPPAAMSMKLVSRQSYVLGRQFSVSAGRFKKIKKYTISHEWISIDSKTRIGTIGITNYAQEKLGDIVFVDLPEVGSFFEAGSEFAAVESVKSASDIMCPAAGEVIEVNENLTTKPALINQNPEGSKGWIAKIEIDEDGMEELEDLDDLIDEEAYKRMTENME